MNPCYQPLSEDPKAFGCTIRQWKGEHTTEGGWQFPTSSLRSVLTEKTRMLVMNIPHNPTGWCPSDKQWDEIINICRERNLYLLSDNIYSMIPRNDGIEHSAAACDIYEKSVNVCGFSKTMGCPGIRIGWLVTHDQV